MDNTIGLATGQYDFTFVEFEEKVSTIRELPMIVAKLALTGYKGYIVWDTFVNTEHADWKWRMFGCKLLQDIPVRLEGATFLCSYSEYEYEEGKHGRIKNYLAEKVT